MKTSIAIVLTLAWAPIAVATDQWSRGSTDESWTRIARLQSVGRSTGVPFEFVSSCTKSANAVERAAAVCWIARTSSVQHVQELVSLLDDPSLTIRKLAWNALVGLPDTAAARAMLREMDTREELPPFDVAGLPMEATNQFPENIWKRPLLERKKWIAEIKEREAWVESFANRQSTKNKFQIELKSSVIEAAEDLVFTVLPNANFIGGANFSGHIHAATASVIASPSNVYLRVSGVLRQRELLRLKMVDHASGTAQISPGIYTVYLLAQGAFGHTSTSDFPFYFRVFRTAAQDQEIEQLLQQPLTGDSVKRLGQLRSQKAVPMLIDHFLAAEGCEQMLAGNALASIGDAQAAKAFLKVSNLSCRDSEWSCQYLMRWLAPGAKQLCSEALLEMGNPLIEHWSPNLSTPDRSAEIGAVRLAFYNCERPLPAEHDKVGAEIISRLLEEAKQLSSRERQGRLQMISEFVVSYLGSESERIIEWIRANKDDSELVVAFVYEFTWPARMEATGFGYTKRCLQAVADELGMWKLSSNLSDSQKRILDSSLAYLKGAIEGHSN